MHNVIMLSERRSLSLETQEQTPYFCIDHAPRYEVAKGAATRNELVTIWSNPRDGLVFPGLSNKLEGYGRALTRYKSHPDETAWHALVVALEKHPRYTHPQTKRVVVIRHALVLYNPCQLEARFWTFDERLKFS
jgi:hypothetical protein